MIDWYQRDIGNTPDAPASKPQSADREPKNEETNSNHHVVRDLRGCARINHHIHWRCGLSKSGFTVSTW
jgi:hypothetical protein